MPEGKLFRVILNYAEDKLYWNRVKKIWSKEKSNGSLYTEEEIQYYRRYIRVNHCEHLAVEEASEKEGQRI